MLEETGWRSHRPLDEAWHEGRYGQPKRRPDS